MNLKKFLKKMPGLGCFLFKLKRAIQPKAFPGTINYWEQRYFNGGNSGSGSYNRLAIFKAEIINQFIEENQIQKVIEFGCGDGHQLSLAKYPQYIGFDVSRTALTWCMKKFIEDKSKSFFIYDTNTFADNVGVFSADLALSLDVIFHLVEKEVFESYLRHLFNASTRYVIIYSSNVEINQIFHEKHRQFIKFIAENIECWELFNMIDNIYKYDPKDPDNTSNSDFYFFRKIAEMPR